MRSGFECRTESVWASWWCSLSHALRLSSRWLKRAPEVCGSGVSVWPGSGSQQRWHHVIIRDRFWAGWVCGQSWTPRWHNLYLSSELFGEVSTSVQWACSFLRCCSFIPLPRTHGCSPFEPQRMLAESWKINALTLGREELGFGQFGPSCVNYSFVRRDSVTNAAAAEVH